MIAIIDYGLGNLASIKNALESIGIENEITEEKEKIQKADKLILSGVGAFGYGIENLNKMGLIDVLNEEILVKKKPILGICLGMQLMCTKSYEGGEFRGLGWIDAEVVRFDSKNKKFRVPHIGWNDVECNLDSPLFKGGRNTETFYFVHSYYLKPKDEEIIIGTCDYGIKFCAAIQKENIFATQFHPEKSQYEGLQILRNFSSLQKC